MEAADANERRRAYLWLVSESSTGLDIVAPVCSTRGGVDARITGIPVNIVVLWSEHDDPRGRESVGWGEGMAESGDDGEMGVDILRLGG